ncbi:hypothetical protein [Hyphococcus sp.]|uniref:hypothetical protein n=1 Tax=Hyphococcus sp. TaxID=2038636 RepID=UPI0035C6C837
MAISPSAPSPAFSIDAASVPDAVSVSEELAPSQAAINSASPPATMAEKAGRRKETKVRDIAKPPFKTGRARGAAF